MMFASGKMVVTGPKSEDDSSYFLVYRMIKPTIVLITFVSGKIILTGAMVREEIYTAFNTIYNLLYEFHEP